MIRLLLLIAAILTFLLALFHATVGGASELDLVAAGLAFFAGAHLFPAWYPVGGPSA